VVPSRQLVIVRMGPSSVGDGSLRATGRLVAEVVAAIDARAPPSARAATSS